MVNGAVGVHGDTEKNKIEKKESHNHVTRYRNRTP